MTEWTCARCGYREVVAGTGQPKNWCRFYFANPPRHAEHNSLGDLCNECGGLAVDFIHSKDKETMRQAREMARVLREVHDLSSHKARAS